MKLTLFSVIILLSTNCYSQMVLKTVDETKELIQGKWDLYEYCVYEANFCKKDSSSSLIFNSIIGENKLGYTLLEKGVVIKKGIVGIYDFVKVRTNDKYTLDNFLFSPDYALIVSFLDTNTLGLVQDSNQGYAKHYKRDKNYKAEPILLINNEK